MVCCTLAALLLALPLWVLGRFRTTQSPLAWRLADDASPIVASHMPRSSEEVVCAGGSGIAERVVGALRRRYASFRCALAGVGHVAAEEPNRHLMMAGTLIALGAGVRLGISAADWRWIALAVFVVWSAEALNTAVESVCDLVSPGYSAHVRIAKDTAAGAVLLAAIAAAVIGVLTFAPYVATLGASARAPASPLSLASPAAPAFAWCGGAH